ncbi:MAG: thioredoxin-dependent thiol peroxidase [Magnetococcales bacterium]|nr:thioredoxin-dependent thiol peroxidase [Magnetococcales bacterium]
MLLNTGDTIPSLTIPDQNGNEVALESLLGKNGAVIYFYPKDNTPGCTLEANDFQRLSDDFAALGINVVGISKDSVASHTKFSTKHNLTFTLLSDGEGAACEGFGVWQEKKNYGKVYMGIVRSTFLVDAKGKVVKTWTKVKTKGHAEAVLQEAG